MADQDGLAVLLKQILSGTANLGLSTLPLLKAFAQARASKDWKYMGLKEWLLEDPEAAVLLAEVLQDAQQKLPENVRAGLIAALGGTP